MKDDQDREKKDVLGAYSDLPGFTGMLETYLRRFRNVTFGLVLIGIAIVCFACMGVAIIPGVYFYHFVEQTTRNWMTIFRYAAVGFSIAAGYGLYGFTIILVVPLANFLLPFRLRPWRGPWFSLSVIKWYCHNALNYTVRYTFLELFTPSPFNILYYRLMGMKIGKGVMINTTNISDPCLVTLEDHVTLGGSATVFCHYGQKGYLVIERVVIKKGATIGLKASVMGDVVIGEGVQIPPHTAVLPKSRIMTEADLDAEV
jgi:F0F1-type ATP synthase membrane subunit c/vacuolar-type H+-ATPase subunit K